MRRAASGVRVFIPEIEIQVDVRRVVTVLVPVERVGAIESPVKHHAYHRHDDHHESEHLHDHFPVLVRFNLANKRLENAPENHVHDDAHDDDVHGLFKVVREREPMPRRRAPTRSRRSGMEI